MLNLSSDEMEALVEHREKLDAELEQLRENRMELEAEIEGKENALNIIDKIIEETEVSYFRFGNEPKCNAYELECTRSR